MYREPVEEEEEPSSPPVEAEALFCLQFTAYSTCICIYIYIILYIYIRNTLLSGSDLKKESQV